MSKSTPASRFANPADEAIIAKLKLEEQAAWERIKQLERELHEANMCWENLTTMLRLMQDSEETP